MTNHIRQSKVRESDVHYLEFLNRENHVRHHYYDEEMKQYELLKIGNPDAVTEGMRLFSSQYLGHLSDDPLRNIKYMFVASVFGKSVFNKVCLCSVVHFEIVLF